MASGPARPLGQLSDVLTSRFDSTAAAGPVHSRDPCSCRLACTTVPIPSDRDRAESVGTPLLQFPLPLGHTPTAPTKLDAVGNAAELQFADAIASYSNADSRGGQEAEPTCNAATRYITNGRPPALPPNALSRFPSHQRPSRSDIQELAGQRTTKHNGQRHRPTRP